MDLTRDAIINANDVEMERVDVPEWGGALYVRVLDGDERDEWDAELARRRKADDELDMDGLRVSLICRCACDATGAALFTTADAEALGKRNSRALRRVADAAARLNRLPDEAIEEAAKN